MLAILNAKVRLNGLRPCIFDLRLPCRSSSTDYPRSSGHLGSFLDFWCRHHDHSVVYSDYPFYRLLNIGVSSLSAVLCMLLRCVLGHNLISGCKVVLKLNDCIDIIHLSRAPTARSTRLESFLPGWNHEESYSHEHHTTLSCDRSKRT